MKLYYSRGIVDNTTGRGIVGPGPEIGVTLVAARVVAVTPERPVAVVAE